ncbi:CheY-like chemotaxis protein [Rhizobium skierniewicense]|uniref:CheY-like chemotaxis protein n=1 Tax=Rhizobium skierniewicense TaxID=984260 RepID=A0A7W6C5B6_9HYPH|nr:response regulator [Rhizobium skierniewicense]MBB3946017.1 CheY-like chemotaxis protein [Rhizobium skierniewicense]NTF32779.1 response regulator [Rhizobium skierniewicense]
MQEPPRLLVVEDDGLIRLDLVDMVSDLGCLAYEASTADQAVTLLERQHSISAILTDIDMPGSINGLGLANVAHRRWPHIKVVVISGRYNPAEGILPPGAIFITKPVSQHSVEKALSAIGVLSL